MGKERSDIVQRSRWFGGLFETHKRLRVGKKISLITVSGYPYHRPSEELRVTSRDSMTIKYIGSGGRQEELSGDAINRRATVGFTTFTRRLYTYEPKTK